MDNKTDSLAVRLFGTLVSYMRRFIFRVLSVGPIPNHIAFILDGNRRFARKWNIGLGMGYRAGFLSLLSLMKYCYELGVKYVTVYAFSIDNFKRQPEEVEYLMNLMFEKIEVMLKEERVVNNQYGMRVYFVGNLNLLSESVRIAAEKAMKATSNNTRSVLVVCVAYTSTDEIVHAVQGSCQDKLAEIQSCGTSRKGETSEGKTKTSNVIRLSDVETHMRMGIVPDPDMLIRTSGESRLSNFLLWQTSSCLLYSPKVLWPEIGLRHFVWAVLNFQKIHPYLEKGRRKRL